MMKKKKILVLIESLSGGGVEKVLSTVVRYINQEYCNIMVCVLSGGGVYEKDIAGHVDIHVVLKNEASYKGLWKIWYKFMYYLVYYWLPSWLVYMLFIPKGNDVEVAFVEGYATKLLAASNNKRAKKIAWVHADLISQPWTLQKGVFKDIEDERRTYRKYDKIVCVSKSVEKVMNEEYGLTSTVTIYNPVDTLNIIRKGKECSSFNVDYTRFNIVSVGRMAQEKGYDILLPIIQRVTQTCPNVHLWLIGTGAEETALKKQTADLGIEGNVTFTGFLNNPYSLMSKMDLFVCSSRAEGFSLVIAESMVLGVPVISTSCSGPKELIGCNEYGILCNTYEELEREILNAVKIRTVHKGVPPIVDINETMKKVSELLGLKVAITM